MTLKRLQCILDRIVLTGLTAGWQIVVMPKGDGFLLQVQFTAQDIETLEPVLQKCRKWYISSHAVPQEVVRTAYKAVLAAAEHEVAEGFFYNGANLYNPHIDPEVQKLAASHTVLRRRLGA